MRPFLALAFLLSTPAQAVDLDLSVEVGSNTVTKTAERYRSDVQTSAIGLRSTLGLPGKFSAVAAYNFHSEGSQLVPPSGDVVSFGLFQQRIELGLQRAFLPTPWFNPVLGLSAVFNVNQITLDDNISSRLNPGVVIERAPSAGLLPYVGARFHFKRITAHMNLGYSVESRPNFDTFGSVSGSNLSFRTGVGLRF